MLDIITIGSTTRDIFLISNAFKIQKSANSPTGLMECVPFGNKIEIEKAVYTTGGGGTNAAATFASLGFKTGVVTRIGDDSSARDVLDDLKKFKVKTNLISQVRGGVTALGVQLSALNGERSVLVNRGVSSDFTDADIPWKALKSDWIYMTSLAGNLALVHKIVRHAKKNGIKAAFNPGSGELAKGLKGLQPIIKDLTVLNLNSEEAQKLAGTKSASIKELFTKIAVKDLTVIITDGPKGAYAHLNGTTWFARPRCAKAISRTGAGDAFGSGLVAGLMKNMGIDDALRVGMANAESVIQSYGAKIGILDSWPSESTLKKYKIKII